MTDKPKTTLRSIPSELTLGILKRMPTETIVRMRRTCSTINNQIEENSTKLASRPYLGIEMKLSHTGFGAQMETVAFTDKGDGYLYLGNLAVSAEGEKLPFEERMSGISFSKIILMHSIPSFRIHLSILRRLKPICKTLCIDNLLQPYIDDIAEYVEFKETSELPFTWKSNTLEVLNKAKKRSLFCITYVGDEDLDAAESTDLFDVLDKVKNFKKVASARTTPHALQEFLWDLYKLNEKISLKWIQLIYFYRQRAPIKAPPLYMFRKVRGNTVHLMITPLQFVVIFDRYNSMIQVVLVEKSEEEVIKAIRSHGVQFEEDTLKAELHNYLSSSM